MLKKSLAALLALLTLVSVGAQAAEYGYAIDVRAMKAVEERSGFPLQVTEKKVVEDCFDVELFDNANDALVFTVENSAQDVVITGVRVFFVACDADSCTVNLEGDLIASYSPNATPKINSVSREGLSLAQGDTCIFSTKVDFNAFVGVRAMVSEYTDAEGRVVVNPDFAEWQNLAFGLGGAASTELD